ncbi:MAG: ATP-binding cassette domain-containing protein [Planctomycetota bacterium]|nr:ATP-binding cassette domain-containing protein [Planctomycetaceae bacterium]MDQ3329682.1 ATP-binding cassette domain-containing protein [Planctomycetota bacterium]
MTAPVPKLALRDVDRRFGSQSILRGLSIDVFPGETLVLIGESGCGKSLTLKLIMDLLAPSSGVVAWDGEDVATIPPRERTRRRLRFGYLFQGAALFDSLSVYENVAFGLKQNTDLSPDRMQEIVADRLHEVGLSDAICDRKPAQLSGGQKKRVALARALALMPEVMFYDEPTTGLDPIMTDVINELIVQTSRSRPVTSIVVTHEMSTVRKVADRVVMLYPTSRLDEHESQVIFNGTAAEAFESEDPRVLQFVLGQAGDRLRELEAAR